MSGYAKAFSSMLDSTVWTTPPTTRCVWMALLLMADRDGLVEASIPGLARRAAVSLEETELALELFLAPDTYSRTTDHEGRRIEVIDGGWKLLNYEKYRDKATLEEKREKDAARQQRKRERHARSVTQRDAYRDVTPVTLGHEKSPLISSASASQIHTESAPEPSVPPESDVQIKVHEGPQGRLPERIWQELWEAAYGREFIWSANTGRNGEVSQLHAVWRSAAANPWQMDPEPVFRHWVKRYLLDQDKWMTERDHPAIGLASRVNQYGKPGAKSEKRGGPPSNREFAPEPPREATDPAKVAAFLKGFGKVKAG